MALRANLQTPATRWPTIAVLTTSGLLLLLVIATAVSVPAIVVGEAEALVSWLPYLSGALIAATVLSTIVLQRRSS